MDPKETSNQSMIDGAAGLIKPTAPRPAAPAQPAQTPAQTPQAAAPVQPIVVDTPLLGKQVYGDQAAAELKTFQDVQKFAKDTIGYEIKTVNDFVPFFAEYKVAKEKAVQAEQLQKTVDNLTTNLNNLPPDISLLVNTALSGENHAPLLQKLSQKAVMDFQKPFESQDLSKIASFYTGKSYTKESIEALDPSVKDVLKDSVRLKYEADRSEFVNLETNTKKAMEQKQVKTRASMESSISQLLASNPGMGKAEVERVRQIMSSGLSDTLFTKEQTWAPDAAEKIAYMEFGKATVMEQAKTIGDYARMVANKEVSKVQEGIMLRSDKPPVQGAQSAAANQMAQQVAQATSWLPPRRR